MSILNYRESLIELEDTEGQTHVLSAFKIKHLKGNTKQSTIYVELSDGIVTPIHTNRPVADLRDEWYSKLDAACVAA